MKISKPFFIFILIFIPIIIGIIFSSSKNDSILGIGIELIFLSIAFIIIFISNSHNILLPINIKVINFKSILYIFFLGLLCYFLVICLTLIFRFFKIGDFSIIDNHVSINFLTVLESSLVAPICEEVFFRVAILSLLLKKVHSNIAIILQAIIFAFLHCFSFTSITFWTILTSGIVYGYIFYNTKSVLLSILSHLFYNSSAIIHLVIFKNNSFSKNSNFIICLLSILGGLICFILISYLISSIKASQHKTMKESNY